MLLSGLAAYWAWDSTVTVAEEAVANAGEVLTDSFSTAVTEVVRELVAVAGLFPVTSRSVFEPYQRAHTIESMPPAIGIGLSFSRHFSRLMGGDLTYRYENGWRVFELRLRAAEASQEETRLSGLSGAPG